MDRGEKKNGVSVKHILIPTAIVLLFLHAFIVVNTVRINRMGQHISAAMQRSFAYSQAVKDFETETDLLADKARLYVSTGGSEYLRDYYREMGAYRQKEAAAYEMMAGLADESAGEEIASAATWEQRRVQIEYRAMRLCAEAYQADLTGFPEVAGAELSVEEAERYTAEQKRIAAEKMLIGTQYIEARSAIRDCIDSTVRIVSQESSGTIIALSQTLRGYQVLQWAITGTIIVLLAIVAVMVVSLLVAPLEKSAEEVRKGELLPADRGVSEYRDLASAYNELLHHRRMMENYLRKQTQTDALTGLPNRLAFQNHITDLSWNKRHFSVVAFSLDVNGLKETNDTKGHASGDALLCAAADAIRTAFGEGGGRECFRFGGDEFAAFWVDVPPSEIDASLERFRQEQSDRGISVSVGYAFAADLDETSVEELLEQADKAMYEDKARHHKRLAAEESRQERLWQTI